MAFDSLRDFMAVLEERGELRRVKTRVSPVLEITEILDRVVKRGGPALLFENVEGSEMPVFANAFGTRGRMELALGGSFDEIGSRLRGILEMEAPRGIWDGFRKLSELRELAGYSPRVVKKAPCKEVVVEEPSLDVLPVLKCWPGDGGRFITLPLVITRDSRGRQNMGMYRMQVFDSRTTGMHWHVHKHGARDYLEAGEKMDVAVAIGADPATVYAATAPLPDGVDELLFAGFLRRKGVEVVKAEKSDILVPANAEIILEGYIVPGELRVEGPFGDHTGYYSLEDRYPVFHLTCITHRRDPIYHATIVGRPPMEDAYLGKATERIFLPLIKLQLPEIVDINLPVEGVFHNLAIVSIRKRYPGQARKVMLALWGMGQLMFTKTIVVVDSDVDVQNPGEVLWAVSTRFDPARDTVIIDRTPTDTLDHASPLPNLGSKLGIDATRKTPGEGYQREWPEALEMTREIKELVDRKWKEYGIG